jgi:PKD repeat protein
MYTFRLYNRSLSSAEVLQNYMSWTSKTPVASFTTDVTSGFAPLSVQFTDTSTGSPTSWNWNFGDGNTSTAQNPSHTYSTPGTYTVSLNVSDGNVSNISTKPNLITVTNNSGNSPIANFMADVTSGRAPLTVHFTDLSTNATSWNWNFGDGNTSTAQNPSHTYSTPRTYTVNLSASNDYGSSISTKPNLITVNDPGNPVVNNEGELQIWAFDASEVSGVPNNIYTAAKTIPYTSNVSLTYNSALGSIDSKCWHEDEGETYIVGAFPTVNENLTFTMGVDSNSEWSYGYMHTSVAYVGVRHASNGNYEIVSYWTSDNGNQLESSFQVPASSVVNNRVTVSIHSYDSNRTNVITAGPGYVTTPYTTQTTRNLPYPNVIQPVIYVNFWASGTGGWVNVHLYDITQSIPRNTITPYARNDIMGFGLDCPDVTGNQLGTDFLISHNQSATVFVSGTVTEDEVDYNEYLFNHGFEEGMHFYPGLASQSLEDSKTTIDTQMAHFNSLFGAMPTSWSSHANDDNITHAIYIYQKYGALYRTGHQGMNDYVANSANLQNSTWYSWWNISSAHGAINPCFTHQTDIYPAPQYAIDPNLFETFVTNLNSNGIDLVSFAEWYYSSMAQTATTNVLESDANHIKFQLSTSGGYPVNVNVQTLISPSYLYCDGVSIPFHQTSDGIQFMSVGNGTYTLTNVVNDDFVVSSSSHSKHDTPRLNILVPNNTQTSNSSEEIGTEIEPESGSTTISKDIGKKIEPESDNKTTEGLQTKPEESQSIPCFEIYCGVACLLGAFIYRRK